MGNLLSVMRSSLLLWHVRLLLQSLGDGRGAWGAAGTGTSSRRWRLRGNEPRDRNVVSAIDGKKDNVTAVFLKRRLKVLLSLFRINVNPSLFPCLKVKSNLSIDNYNESFWRQLHVVNVFCVVNFSRNFHCNNNLSNY